MRIKKINFRNLSGKRDELLLDLCDGKNINTNRENEYMSIAAWHSGITVHFNITFFSQEKSINYINETIHLEPSQLKQIIRKSNEFDSNKNIV